MEDYKPNSHKYKNEQKELPKKKVEKVVTGNVRVRKKTQASKFKDVFISEDAANVKSYILMDVLVPAVKKAVADIVTDGIDMILYGGSGGGRSKNRSRSSKVSYTNFYDRRDEGRSRIDTRRTSYGVDDIVLDTRGEAEDILMHMRDIIDEYDFASVADLYDLVGVTGSYTDNKYGWDNIRNAEVVRVRDGYLLKMPKAKPIN